MNRKKVETALKKVEKALDELQGAVGDGQLYYLTGFVILDKDGKDPGGLTRTYRNVDGKLAIALNEAQLDELKGGIGKATREEYEEAAKELLADVPPEKLS